MSPRLLTFPVLLIASSLFAQAPGTDGYIIFKDGFSIHGKVIQQKKFELDPVSGAAYVIPTPGGFTFIDDGVRRIYFPPGQIAETVRLKPGELEKDAISLVRTAISPRRPVMLSAWRFEKLPPFDKVWERNVVVGTVNSSFPMHQRIVQLTPYRMHIQSLTHGWEMHFLTKELAFDEVTKLVTDYLDTKKEFAKTSPEEKEFQLANFYQQMGNFDAADAIARKLLAKLPEYKKRIEDFRDLIAHEKAKKFAAELEPLSNARQHRPVIDRLAFYDREGLIDKVPEKTKLLVQDLKNRYEADDAKLVKTRALLTDLRSRNPEPKEFFSAAIDTIGQELNYDTLPRLETFITFAEQYQRDIQQNKVPSVKLEEVLALAITGWHLGHIAAEPDVKLAQNLWKGRLLMPEYMQADTVGQRAHLAEKFDKETNLPIDVVARLLQHLPPPNALKNLSNEFMSLDIDIPDGPKGQYYVQLPPDYHHHRAHPVLMLLHGREAADILTQRWQALAARHGFILVSPNWTKFSKSFYAHSEAEQIYLRGVLKDVKRRFQVDTDRVFLFGWDEGGTVAWDTALAHPDQYAGLLAMCGMPQAFAKNYWPNAQNLGIYAVDGDKNGAGPITTRGMFKEFIRCNYNAYFLEYKGRANELYVAEFEPMMDWMSRKKRQYPTRSLGNFSTSGASAEEFRSFRGSDNRFYWLGSDELNENNTQDYANWIKHRQPAKFQGTITVANEAGSKGAARITTNIALRLQGLKQITVWLSPAMIDFTHPIQMRINGRTIGPARVVAPSIPTMLEEYHFNVDRQRLYYAKIDMKLG